MSKLLPALDEHGRKIGELVCLADEMPYSIIDQYGSTWVLRHDDTGYVRCARADGTFYPAMKAAG
jgi:hypothetical protein